MRVAGFLRFGNGLGVECDGGWKVNSRGTKSPGKDLSRRALLFLFVMVAALDGVSAAGAEITPSQGSKMPGVTGSMLMLVREWNPESGTLTGWLPMHRAAIQLELFDKLPPPHLDLNDALNVTWLPAKDFDPPETEVRVSPPSRLIEGQRWLPAERDANMVRVAKRLFLVRKVIFGGSRWRLPTKFSESTIRRDATQ